MPSAQAPKRPTRKTMAAKATPWYTTSASTASCSLGVVVPVHHHLSGVSTFSGTHWYGRVPSRHRPHRNTPTMNEPAIQASSRRPTAAVFCSGGRGTYP
ncbi:hypothetical protein [Streptomyces aureus]|uniref:hypothetical protein n=1 Tax=Streptomyces aureus TaxID=193461 RepID=UPI00363794E1